MDFGILVFGAFLDCQLSESKNGPYLQCAVSVGMDAYRITMERVQDYDLLKTNPLGCPILLRVRVYGKEKGGYGLAGGVILACGDDARALLP